MIYLVEFDAANPLTGAVERLRFGSEGYTTRPDDDLPNTHFENRVVDPGNFERTVFSDGRTSGASTVGAGVIELVIADGELDFLVEMAVDGRSVIIWSLENLYSCLLYTSPSPRDS